MEGSSVSTGTKKIQPVAALINMAQHFDVECHTYGLECRDLLYAFLVVGNFSPRPTLLAEPKHPAGNHATPSIRTEIMDKKDHEHTYVGGGVLRDCRCGFRS